MSVSPIALMHTSAILAVLAVNPAGCDDSSSPAPRTPTSTLTDSIPGVGGGGGHGGTPEPASLLLLGGAAAGYLGLRRRRKDNGACVERED